MGTIGNLTFFDIANNNHTIDDDYGDVLYLTPLLKSGNKKLARKKSRVGNLANNVNIESYSGYLTVNEEFNSNMFFWFFPALERPETAPVILWLQGGPGSSSLIGLFNGFGPFVVNSYGELENKSITWISNHSVIFLDNPVGAGLSFTDNDFGYVSNQEEVCRDLHKALSQFFEIFPDFGHQDFYIAGNSYAGKYVPHFGVKIHEENLQTEPSKPINLKGLIIGSSFTDPLVQINWGEFLYNVGLIDEYEKEYFNSEIQRMQDFIRTEMWLQAFEIMQKLMFAYPPPMVSYYEKITGLSNTFNLLESGISEKFFYYKKFLAKPSTRNAIHVGKRQLDFGETKKKVFMALAEDIPKSAKPEMEKLLNLGYPMLLFSGIHDVVVPVTSIMHLLLNLNWVGAEKFSRTERQIWKFGNEPSGYVKRSNKLTQILIRNAGHMATFDQPEWCFDMITRFTRNMTFDSIN